MNVILNATTRDIMKKKTESLRADKKIPAVLYGRKTENKNLTIDAVDFERAYNKAGESTLIDLAIDGGTPTKVLVNSVQANPIKQRIDHVDLYEVDMTQKITTATPLEFIGEAPAVKELGGILVKNLEEVETECLPSNLVSSIQVDLSSIKTFDDAIRVSDIKAPQGIEILNEPEQTVATATEPVSEEELAKLDEAVEEDVSKVEVEGEKKEEAEEKKED